MGQKAKERKSLAATKSNQERFSNKSEQPFFGNEDKFSEVTNWSPPKIEKQKTREVVAEKIGMKSTTFERAKKVVEKIEQSFGKYRKTSKFAQDCDCRQLVKNAAFFKVKKMYFFVLLFCAYSQVFRTII